MSKYSIFVISLMLSISSLFAEVDCPSDSAYHVDMRSMLPDGSPNPSYGQQISTGLCACVMFNDGIEINGNEITFTINIVDNEPIRGIELDVHHDFAELTFESVSGGEKFKDLIGTNGLPFNMDVLANWNEQENYLKVLAYSLNRLETLGDGEEGSLLHLTYTLADGAVLPDNISFHFSVINIPGTSLDPELLNVVCSYPDEDNPIAVSTSTASLDDNLMLPKEFALFQNYPNPFNPSTQISFDIPSSEFITLRIFNLLGQDVKMLANKLMNPGRYTFEWDGKDLLSNDVASGVYFYELRGESFISRKKMLLIR